MTFFIELARSWRGLFILLQPSELTTMGLMILNKVISIYQSMLILWWFVLLLIGCILYEQSLHAIPVISLTIYAMFILLLSRSSVPLKSARYIFASNKTIIAGFLSAVIVALQMALPTISFPHMLIINVLLGCHAELIIVSPIIGIMILCLLDAHLAVIDMFQALWRGLKIFLYQYPFFIIVYLSSWYILYPLIAYPFAWFGVYGNLCIVMLWIPWYSAAIVYGYTRFMREHMDYYY